MTWWMAGGLWLVLLSGCDWSLERMVDQPRCDADEATTLLAGGTCNQRPPAGALPFRPDALPRATETGVDGGAGYVEHLPLVRSRELLLRGRRSFETFCAPCHGVLGDGDSQVAENMTMRKPPSLHEPRIVALADGKLFRVVSVGYGLMPAYQNALPAPDRWAVVAYLRALQLSQDVQLDALPDATRTEARSWLN